MSNIAVAIVLYNPNYEKILQEAKLFLEHGYYLCIADNTPNFVDEKLQELQAQNSMFHYTALQENQGIAYAQNVILGHIKEREELEFCFFLDQDSSCEVDVPTKLKDKFLAISDAQNLFALGCNIISAYTKQPMREISDTISKVNQLINAGMLVPLAKIRAVGGPLSDLFIDYVDFEWCLRAKSQGFYCAVAHGITITHPVGEDLFSICGMRMVKSKPFRYFYQYRNTIWLYKQSYIPMEFKLRTMLRYFLTFIYGAIFFKPRREYLKNMFRGIVAGLFTFKVQK